MLPCTPPFLPPDARTTQAQLSAQLAAATSELRCVRSALVARHAASEAALSTEAEAYARLASELTSLREEHESAVAELEQAEDANARMGAELSWARERLVRAGVKVWSGDGRAGAGTGDWGAALQQQQQWRHSHSEGAAPGGSGRWGVGSSGGEGGGAWLDVSPVLAEVEAPFEVGLLVGSPLSGVHILGCVRPGCPGAASAPVGWRCLAL